MFTKTVSVKSIFCQYFLIEILYIKNWAFLGYI